MQFNQVITRLGRFCLAVAACALLVFSSPAPAMAISSTPSSPSKGAEQLEGIQKEAEESLQREPRGTGEVTSKAAEGINEVQGRANAKDNYAPGNSRGKTVREQAEDVLESITP